MWITLSNKNTNAASHHVRRSLASNVTNPAEGKGSFAIPRQSQSDASVGCASATRHEANESSVMQSGCGTPATGAPATGTPATGDAAHDEVAARVIG